MQARSVIAQAIASFVGIALLGPAMRAQTPPASSTPAARVNYAYRYRLLGVYDEASGDPIEGVEVSDVLGGNKSLTTSTGTLSLVFLPEGATLVRLRKVGFEVQTMTIAISPADTAPLTIIMRKSTQLPTVVVTDSATKHLSPSLRAFEEHKKTGLGQYVEESYLRKNDDRSLAQSLAPKLAGVRTVTDPSGATYLVSSRKECSGPVLGKRCNAPNCYVRVFLDGIQTTDNSTPGRTGIDLNHLNTLDYAAAEFYPGGMALPNGISALNSDCGTLLLYTRMR